MDYGIKIKQYRIRAGYTLDEAAKLVGTTPVSLSRYENDDAEIPVTVFVKLARLYKFDVFDIMGVRHPDKDMSDEEFAVIVGDIEETLPDLEVDQHRGEQPLYPVIFSIE